jgi:hypothetical protein
MCRSSSNMGHAGSKTSSRGLFKHWAWCPLFFCEDNMQNILCQCGMWVFSSRLWQSSSYPGQNEITEGDIVIQCSIRPSLRHFCVRGHILKLLWQISLKLVMSIYMDKRMMHAKWHCTPSVNNGVRSICVLKKCFLAHLRLCSWWAFVIAFCPSSIVRHAPSTLALLTL